MEGNEELQKKARGGEMAIKGTVTPDVTTEPVAPAKVADPSEQAIHKQDLRDQEKGWGPGPDED